MSAPARELRGYLLSSGAPRPVADGALLDGPVAVPAGGAAVRVYPAVAVLLRESVTARTGSGALARAVAAAFVTAHLVWPGDEPDRFVLGDRPVPLPLRGPITVWSGTELPDTCLPEDFGDLDGQLVRLAELTGELTAGRLAVLPPLSPKAGVAVRPGTVQLWGPGDAALVVPVLRADQRDGRSQS